MSFILWVNADKKTFIFPTPWKSQTSLNPRDCKSDLTEEAQLSLLGRISKSLSIILYAHLIYFVFSHNNILNQYLIKETSLTNTSHDLQFDIYVRKLSVLNETFNRERKMQNVVYLIEQRSSHLFVYNFASCLYGCAAAQRFIASRDWETVKNVATENSSSKPDQLGSERKGDGQALNAELF